MRPPRRIASLIEDPPTLYRQPSIAATLLPVRRVAPMLGP
jgi:hypothetical protein